MGNLALGQASSTRNANNLSNLEILSSSFFNSRPYIIWAIISYSYINLPKLWILTHLSFQIQMNHDHIIW